MYGKVFESMYDGTISEDWRALVTMQQLIVLCDADGVVDMTPKAISGRTGIPIEHIQAGIEVLESPDPYSRTPDEEGRRIIRLDEHRPWGWYLVNHEKYKKMVNAEDVRERNRQRKAIQRNKKKNAESVKDSHTMSQGVPPCPTDVTECPSMSRHIDIDTTTDKEKTALTCPDREENSPEIDENTGEVLF